MNNNYKGLTDDLIQLNRDKFGENKIPEPTPPTIFQRIKDVFSDKLMILLLIFSALLGGKSLIEHEIPYDFIGLIITLSLITFVSIRSDLKTEAQYKALKNSIKNPMITVVRNGGLKEIDSTELVVGDLMVIENGQKAYADGIIIENNSLKVSNKDINGESDEIKLDVIDNYEIDFNNIDTEINNKNFIHSGAIITEGKGKAIVVRVGIHTESGKALNNIEEVEKTPLVQKLDRLVEQISMFGYIGASIMFLLTMTGIILNKGFYTYINSGLINIGSDIVTALMLALSIVACAVPEGLPLMSTIVLSKHAKIMKDNNVLVRNINKGETSGSISTLFTDKTGTITKGKLEVVEKYNSNCETLELTDELIKCVLGCNASIFDSDGNIVNGNATDKSLLKWIGKDKYYSYKNKIKIDKLQTFNSTNKFTAYESDGKTFYVGAGEKLFEKDLNLTDKNKQGILNKFNELSNRSMRIIGFGLSNNKLVDNEINSDFKFIGFVGIRDEVRPSSKKAIKQLNDAGVKVTMITGDKKETAIAIAKECGLINSDNDLVYTNDELESMTDDEIKQVLPRIRVIARAMPNMKRKIAQLSQQNGEVVGMTGDGVNDAPALKQADIGFAMGSGTEVAKEAGDIIITDDNLESIVYAVKSGRTIYKNIQKFLKYQLAINVGIVITSVIAPLIGYSQVLSVMSILWINAIMDTLASLALSGEQSEDYYMKEKPINRNANIISKDMIIQILLSSGYMILSGILLLLFGNKMFSDNLLTGYFAMFVFTSIFNGLNVRTNNKNIFSKINSNIDFIKIMGTISIVQILLVQFGGKIFNCVPLNLTQWLIILIMSILIIPIDIIRKFITK